jgi:hypothetical protein
VRRLGRAEAEVPVQQGNTEAAAESGDAPF